MKLKRITGPATYPVTYEEVLRQCVIDNDTDFELLNEYIKRATDLIDGPYGIGVVMVSQVWEMALDSIPSVIKIPIYPILSVDSIKYIDSNGDEQTVDSTVYRVDDYSNPPVICEEYGQSWPSHRNILNGIKIRFTAGFQSVPGDLKQALCMIISHWYENRETASNKSFFDTPFGAQAIMEKYRVSGIN